MLSQELFVGSDGGVCVLCGSGDIEGQGFDYDGGSVWQKVICLTCGGSWVEVYVLARYDNAREGSDD